MHQLCDPNSVNLFAQHGREKAPRCNVDWWSKGHQPDRSWESKWDSTMRTYLNEPLIHTLKNPGSPQYSSVHLSLLKDLYRAIFNEEPTKGFTHELIKGAPPIEYWQWDIFEQVQWRSAHGVHPNEVIEEMKKLHWRHIEYDDIKPESWNNNKDIKQEWRTLRMQVLEAYKARCAICNRTPQQHGVVVHVDHIIPKSRTPQLALCFSNLQVLCDDCNIGKSNHFKTDWRPIVFNKKEIHEYLVPHFRATREGE